MTKTIVFTIVMVKPKYPTTPQTRRYTTLWNIDVRKLGYLVCCDILVKDKVLNLAESWRVAGSSCMFKWNQFIATSLTNLRN